jgi:2-polyprenyl-6-methoxyphenol hydroxylase-like FAD-dependent oxidoreductase
MCSRRWARVESLSRGMEHILKQNDRLRYRRMWRTFNIKKKRTFLLGGSGMSTDRRNVPVIVAGAGPTGLTLATELRRGAIDVLLLDQRAHRAQNGSRAAGMQPRTVEMLDQRGVVDRFLAAGPRAKLGNFAGIVLDYSTMPTRFPYALNIMQVETEQLLEDIAAELGAPVEWSTTVTGFRQDATGVDVDVDTPNGPTTLRGSYLVACDGGRSTIRKSAGVAFPGTDATMACLIGDVELDDPPASPLFLDRRERGTVTAIQFRPGWYRVVTSEPQRAAGPDDPVILEELRESLLRVAGTDFGMHSPRWLSHFNDAVRQAERYRIGRVLLAGDAAHIHLPAGGQGMNMGMQDAFNLGWKLATVVRGDATDALLDTYHDERHAADADTLNLIRAQAALFGMGDQITQLHNVFAHLVGFSQVNTYLSATMSLLDLRYPGFGDHPLLGRRVPDIAINTGGYATRIYELLHEAKPVLLSFSDDAALTQAAPWAGRVTPVRATTAADPWTLPDGTAIPAPAALLIRPDGYVPWITDGGTDLADLHETLTTWCGAADGRIDEERIMQ